MSGILRIQAALGLRAAGADPGLYGSLAPFIEVYGSRSTAAGVAISPRRSMQISAVYGCVSILSNAVASLPLELYRRKENGGKERATDHPLYNVLKYRPSQRHTASEFRALMQRDVETCGNGYAVKVTVAGVVEQLVYVTPERVEVERDDGGRIWYLIGDEDGRGKTPFAADRVFHLRGPFGDGIVAAAPATEFRELFGLAYAIEAFLSNSFRNGVRHSGVLQTANKLGDKAYDRLKNWIKEEYEGLLNAGKILLLEEGLTFQGASQSNRDAQVVDLLEKVTAAIARIYGVPLHALASNIAQPRANMEQEAAEFVAMALRSRLVRWEERLQVDVIRDPKVFSEFNLEELLRGDVGTRAQVYRHLVEIGVMTRNEVRVRENLSPLPGLDEPLTPLNMQRGNDDGLAELVATIRAARAAAALHNGHKA